MVSAGFLVWACLDGAEVVAAASVDRLASVCEDGAAAVEMGDRLSSVIASSWAVGHRRRLACLDDVRAVQTSCS